MIRQMTTAPAGGAEPPTPVNNRPDTDDADARWCGARGTRSVDLDASVHPSAPAALNERVQFAARQPGVIGGLRAVRAAPTHVTRCAKLLSLVDN